MALMDSPYDIPVMFGLVALVLLTIGGLLTDVETDIGAQNTSLYTDINTYYGNYRSSGAEMTESLTGEESDSQADDTEGFLQRGARGLLNIGETWTITKNAMFSSMDELGIPDYFVYIIITILAIAMVVVIYTFWRQG